MELETIRGLLTVQSGIYSYLKDDKVENKARGFMVSSVDLEAIENRLELEGVVDKKRKPVAFREALLKKVPEAWKQAAFGFDGSPNPSPSIELVLRTFMTAGQAVASLDRFDLIGRWAEVPKKMTVHTPGPKRRSWTLQTAMATPSVYSECTGPMRARKPRAAMSLCRPHRAGRRAISMPQ